MIKHLLRASMRHCLALTSLPLAMCAGLGRGVRILMYHRVVRHGSFDQLCVTPQRFERHMAWLARRGGVVPLHSAVDSLAAGVATDAVVITFDDGYLDTLENALPILQRYRMPATVFVTTRFCDQAHRHPRYAAEPGRVHMDWSEVRELARAPGITIGSHTMSHPHLPRLCEGEAAAEISSSRRIIETRLGQSVEFFCFPNGDHGEREARLAREAGYQAALTVTPGANRGQADLFRLRRTEVSERDSERDLSLKLLGAYDPVHAALHRRRQRRFSAKAFAVASDSCQEG
jgi:peptidoglycan/xylan/chitin deacetylase (PgdA/CDA1 family)